ncbi:MAG: Ig-like domain-containing protein [Bacteroidales bacterium]|nr:Ig-like domain-containing protein [Bacteroidales bacterium]
MRRSTYIISVICLTLVSMLFAPSCANTSTPPSGGPKDTIPPTLDETVPLPNSTNVSVLPKKNSVILTFSEFVVLKDPASNFYVSPPLKKRVQPKIKGKSVVLTFQDTLKENTTYSIDFGDGIADNNEGNIFPRMSFAFSTGDHVDSIYTSGTVLDAKTQFPKEKITVVLHTDPSDSAVFNLLPVAAAKSDKWGYFTIRNIKPGAYRVYAIEDLNNNNKYDPGEESVAFLDSLFVADSVMRADRPELLSYDPKDTSGIMSRPSAMQLNLFKEHSSKQYIRENVRLSKRSAYIKFNAPYVKIDTLQIAGIPDDKIIREFNIMEDSLSLWFNDQGEIQDTLQFRIKYHKTDDSLQTLVSTWEEFKMMPYKKKFQENKFGKQVEVLDSIARYKVSMTSETIEQEGITIEFDYPLIKAPFDSIQYYHITAKQQRGAEAYTVTPDSTNIRKFYIKPSGEFMSGYEYHLKIPHRIFVDINGNPADSLVKKVTLPNNDDLSTLFLSLENVNGKYIVELISEKRDRVFRTYHVSESGQLKFPYLQKGKFSIRITEDRNRNGILDTGSILEKRQPERVILYKFGNTATDKDYILEIPERTELEQTIDITQLFK